MNVNRILSLTLVLAAILLIQISCTDEDYLEQRPSDVEDIEFNSAAYKQGSELDTKMKILNMGTIDLLNNAAIAAIIHEAVVSEDSDEHITYATLKSAASTVGITLEDLMINSVLAHGGTEKDAAEIADLLDCFFADDLEYCPLIQIPFAEDLDLVNLNPALAVSLGTEPPGSWIGVDYFTFSTPTDVNITELLASGKPVWHVTVARAGDQEILAAAWLPWRRCYCTRGSGGNDPGDDAGSWLGSCSQFRSDENRCGAKCDRTGFNGECDNDPCPGC